MITGPQQRALEAVARGDVEHCYRGSGNVYIAPQGISAGVIRTLERFRLIKDGLPISNGHNTTTEVLLTEKGRRELEAEQ
jgi:hypothetical protein